MQEISIFERVLSSARLEGYQRSYARKLDPDPIRVYQWNITLSELLYPLLHLIEVSFRNALHDAVVDHYRDPNWLVDSKYLDDRERLKLEDVKRDLERKRKLDTGHIIAELKFGFWCALLDRRYERYQLFWPTLLKKTFPHMEGRKIERIRRRFNRIRQLRNRVYHYEPIWHWKDLLQQHEDLLETMAWIEPALLELVDQKRFPEVYQSGPKCLEK